MVKIMGIVNVTPDSFSDGNLYYQTDAAINHGLKLWNEGATILDVGGESTRPGAKPVSAEEEQARILPVIEQLVRSGCVVSVDTRNASTMQAALNLGASIINDVSALQHDPNSVRVMAATNAPVIIMHMQGTPETMQNNPHYNDVVEDVMQFFENQISMCTKNGIGHERIIIDIGIGFGKTLEQNLSLLKALGTFKKLTGKICLGASRKSFIAALGKNEPADQRLAGSIAAALWGAAEGADILRVHDVLETKQALLTWQAIRNAKPRVCTM